MAQDGIRLRVEAEHKLIQCDVVSDRAHCVLVRNLNLRDLFFVLCLERVTFKNLHRLRFVPPLMPTKTSTLAAAGEAC